VVNNIDEVPGRPTNSTLHHVIIKHVIEEGYAPDVPTLGRILGCEMDQVVQALHRLQEYHGVALHPHEPRVWVIHPFSMAPTNFLVRSARGEWWGSCAECSLGIAVLLDEDVTITSNAGGHGNQLTIHVKDGHVLEKDILVHFPVPMSQAWDNVIYTCSTMQFFEDEAQIDDWARRHNIPRGDVQPIENIWRFSRRWYGNHLDPDWKKWTVAEAREIFQEFGLTHEIWHLEPSGKRF
jgi:hypothetical protein